MPAAVRIYENGGPEVLRLEEVDPGKPAAGEIQIRHTAIGVNYIDVYDRTGLYPVKLPSGLGREAAGVVTALGRGVRGLRVGERVAYVFPSPGAYCELRNVPAERAVRVPRGISDEQAAALMLKGLTAQFLIRRTHRVTHGDMILVHAAAGGVGSIAVQLARRAGATVIGLASPANHDWLAGHGVIPVAYGDGVAGRIRQAAGKVDAFIDTFGADYVELALELGVEPSRIDTIANFEAPAKFGVKAEGNTAGAGASTLAELAGLIADGQLELPIAATFPLGQVQDAYRRLASGHIRGKIVLIP